MCISEWSTLSAGFGAELRALRGDRLEAALNGLHDAARAALVALEEEEARVLRERRALRLARLAEHVLLCAPV